ncbi:uncharacterized protein LOC132751720 [Ruditapes philippinarum]|uniref:uncharacterized protein LOC132751720 n=1 Tax=Ruditapes philippinarum TaxID=129788 RepID=UPI00295B1DC5|nr:uncharacterized protein LOC132751720 [Ruditapes philippinarum]
MKIKYHLIYHNHLYHYQKLYKILTMDKWIFRILLYIVTSLFRTSSGFIVGIDSTSSKYRCPDSVAHGKYLHTFQEKCYEFVIYEGKYWKDARNDCTRKGGDLVVVDDAAIQTFLVNTLKSLGSTKDGLWMGLTDIRHELHWEWVNGEPLQGYNNWAHLQGGANFLHLTQDCAQIRMDDNGLWHDRECHLWPNKFSYICEYEMSTPLTQKTSTLSTPLSTTVFGYETTTSSTKLSTSASVSFSSKLPTTWHRSTSSKLPNSALISTSSIYFTERASLHTSTSILMTKISTGINASGKTIKSQEIMNTTSDAEKTFEHLTEPTTNTNKGALHHPSSPISGSSQVSTTIITQKPIICSELNCVVSCPNGYSGVYVGLDGCINCRCN